MANEPLLMRGEEIFRLLVETIEDYGICALDTLGRVTHWNAGAARTLGYSKEEILGKHIELVFTDEDRAAGVPEQELRVAAEQGRAEDERWHVRKDRSRFWAMGIAVPVRDANGLLRGFGKIFRDRTDLKELHETLRTRAAAMAQADEDKNVFLATLAHELRNPLASILGGITLLKKTHEAQHTQQITEMIEQQVMHSKRLIEDLLDIARAERGKLRLQRSAFDLRSQLEQAAQMVEPALHAREQKFSVETPNVPLVICGDPNRVLQIFVNLLSNASKFTDVGGQVAVAATLEGNEAVVRIADNGIGVPSDKLNSIFDMFSQAHAALPGSQVGLGIGLALSSDLVALHSGTIQVRSEGPGKGSEFIVRLPLWDGVKGQRHSEPP